MVDRSRDWLSQAERDLRHAASSHPEGAPFEHYGSLQSDEAISYAGQILDFVRSQMA